MIKKALEGIYQKIAETAAKSSRNPNDIRVVAVTKTVAVDSIKTAFDAGQTIFGENRIQEARQKVALLPQACEWHLIGHLQTNKVKDAVQIFSLIHSVDSLELAATIQKAATQRAKIQRILIQVNVSGESSKFGIAPTQLPDLVRAVSQMSSVRLEGLMTIPPFEDDPEKVRSFFRELRILSESISGWCNLEKSCWELSMGMSHDYEVAVQEGATFVRIGTAIFGDRGFSGR